MLDRFPMQISSSYCNVFKTFQQFDRKSQKMEEINFTREILKQLFKNQAKSFGFKLNFTERKRIHQRFRCFKLKNEAKTRGQQKPRSSSPIPRWSSSSSPPKRQTCPTRRCRSSGTPRRRPRISRRLGARVSR